MFWLGDKSWRISDKMTYFLKNMVLFEAVLFAPLVRKYAHYGN